MIFIPGNLATPDPEGCELNRVARPLVVLALGLVCGTAHLEETAGDRHHGEVHLGAGDGLAVDQHARLVLGLRLPQLEQRGPSAGRIGIDRIVATAAQEGEGQGEGACHEVGWAYSVAESDMNLSSGHRP